MATDTLTFKRGDTWKLSFAYKDDIGTPIYLTDCSARLQVRDKRTKSVLLEGTMATGEVVITAVTGAVDITFLPAVTELVTLGTHETDLEMTYSDGTVESTETMNIKVIEDITRDDS
jgi:hypothetical protein